MEDFLKQQPPSTSGMVYALVGNVDEEMQDIMVLQRFNFQNIDEELEGFEYIGDTENGIPKFIKIL